MAAAPKHRIRDAVLERYPTTYGEDLGIRSPGTPSGSFRLLVMALLMGARIRADTAVGAAQALSRRRWNTPKAMAASTWAQRARTLNESGYARYDERTSTMLGETAEQILRCYRGDVRRLRDAAERKPEIERRLLGRFPGIGSTSTDIFFREVQGAWDELYPFADRRALQAAGRLGLGDDVRALTRLAEGDEFVRLVSGLVRVGLHKEYDDVIAAARR